MNDFNAKVEARSSGEWIVEVVNVGDNVVICVDNSTNDSFQILLVDKGMHTIQESFKDDGNNEYVEGDVDCVEFGMINYFQIVILTCLAMTNPLPIIFHI